MRVTVHYSGQARAAAGRASESVELEDAPALGPLLVTLAARHGERLRRLLLDADGRPHASLLVAVDGVQARSDATTPLRDGAQITLLPPIAGG
jgi:molybdopterin converting factor small subunit